MTISDTNAQPEDTANKLYFSAWRGHFYAGLAAILFLAVLAVTGALMLWIAWFDGRDGKRTTVAPKSTIQLVSVQAEAALAAVPNGVLKQYVAPRAADVAALFRVDLDEDAIMFAVNPYTAEVIETFARRSGWYDFVDGIHSDLTLGVTGDRMLETAASLSLVLVVTGLYMWWPSKAGWRRALMPSFGCGRALWKSLHGVVGIWISLVLVFFLISDLTWAGFWGVKLMQAWSPFPAEKWDNFPLSDENHASMNHDRREVPWVLEQTPMPESGSDTGTSSVAVTPVTIDMIDAFAREIGFDARYQLNVPQTETGVWMLSRDSMSTDSTNPTSDRTFHIDRHTGKILANVQFADYSLAARQWPSGSRCASVRWGFGAFLQTPLAACLFYFSVSVRWCCGGNVVRQRQAVSRHPQCRRTFHFGKAPFSLA